ncbi:hypothetical protein Dsin_030891 [Dipteronia sinensis]|uniref:RNase H type-1 domain-containing protein n=1 Tax=Dipteronia sinensis TaxID=43782 RepID=A0AAE0DSV8_9ROSI|nr:hypothetical protein Dsin_030891 [Dipteronia sinensis]
MPSPLVLISGRGKLWTTLAADVVRLWKPLVVLYFGVGRQGMCGDAPGAWDVGVGAAIRATMGKVLVALSKPLAGTFSAEVGDFLALREGLLLAKAHNLSIQVAETTGHNVASILNSTNDFLGDASFIINDIRGLFLEVGICKCQATTKSGNTLA